MASTLVFLGSKPLGLKALQVLHACQPEAIASVITLADAEDPRSALAGFQAFCMQWQLPLVVAAKPAEAEAALCQLQPDWCVVVGWYWLLKPHTLQQVRHACLGVHNSLLPRYRGSAPLVWAMLADEPEVGMSLFSFTEGMDDGPLWHAVSTPLSSQDTIATVLARLEHLIEPLLQECIPGILNGTWHASEQDETQASYCAQRLPADGQIDWQQPAAYLDRYIRAQCHPYPGAFTWLGEDKLIIQQARLFPQTYYGSAGQVARLTPEGVYVICGDHRALIVESVTLKGETLAARDVIRSIGVRFPS
ncbi:methionyl-tRNA formyltransferase [Leeia sp.]|uniref:methionyl-tRNA formyltransferase n=1 Tax=Leeia sp. TaxID=2884678 RepID=UPI0035B4EC82